MLLLNGCGNGTSEPSPTPARWTGWRVGASNQRLGDILQLDLTVHTGGRVEGRGRTTVGCFGIPENPLSFCRAVEVSGTINDRELRLELHARPHTAVFQGGFEAKRVYCGALQGSLTEDEPLRVCLQQDGVR